MQPIRIVAIPSEIAETVRATMLAPVYGFPAHVETGTETAPCRHCLRQIHAPEERRILFTYDRLERGIVVPTAHRLGRRPRAA